MTLEREWQALQTERYRLQDVLERSRKRLTRLSDEPDMQELLAEMTRLRKKEIPALKEETAQCDAAVARLEELLEERRRAGGSSMWRRVRERRVQAERKRLAELQRRGTREACVRDTHRVIRDLEASIGEMEEDFRALRAEKERQKEDAWKKINDAEDLIADIQEHYRSVRRTLEQKIRETEDQWMAHLSAEQEWSTRSRDHLEWALARQPASADDLLQRYYRRFPDETPVVLPIATAAPRKWKKWRRSCGKQDTARPAAVRNENGERDAPWTLRLTLHPDKEGTTLPRKKTECLQILRDALTKVGCGGSTPERVLCKMIAFTHMEPERRHRLKHVLGKKMKGWRSIRAGRAWRIFLSIDEAARVVRFLPRPRRIAYA